KEVSVITGGYLPEYGKAMGGIVDVVTKTGSNEFHGQAYFNITPGAIEGSRQVNTSRAYSVVTRPYLGNARDFGADVGRPILKDTLWFYTGVQFAFTPQALERNLYQFNLPPGPDAMKPGGQQFDKNGFPLLTPKTCGRADTCAPGTPASP